MRYFIRLSYCGRNYNGWQKQSYGKGIAVQSVLEKAFSVLLRQEILISGCGRTDAGVHAEQYYAHFDSAVIKDKNLLLSKLNKMLPPDIVIHDIIPMADDAHTRFDAISRSYRYHLHTEKSPFAPFSFHYKYGGLNLNLLNQIALLILEFEDFSTFCKTRTDVRTTLCKIKESNWQQVDAHNWVYYITGDRFLRGMVRLIVGMQLNICRGKLTINQVENALKNRIRTGHDWSVPPDGLFLYDIRYPYLE